MGPGGGRPGGLSRRSILQGTFGVSATAIGLSGCVEVDRRTGPDGPLAYSPGYFLVYASAPDADVTVPASFRYPTTPALGGYNDKDFVDRNRCVFDLFDTRRVVREARGGRLRTELRFTPSGALVGRPRPYTIEHLQGGRYSAVTPVEFEPPRVPDRYVWSFLNASVRWRAVVGDFVVLDSRGGEFLWAVTRADFYRLEGTDPVFHLSLQYLFWADDPTRGRDFGTDPPFCSPWVEIPSPVAGAAETLMAAGRLSLDGRLDPEATPTPTETPEEPPEPPERPDRAAADDVDRGRGDPPADAGEDPGYGRSDRDGDGGRGADRTDDGDADEEDRSAGRDGSRGEDRAEGRDGSRGDDHSEGRGGPKRGEDDRGRGSGSDGDGEPTETPEGEDSGGSGGRGS